MKLLGKNVLLTEVEKDVKTAGGIILTGETSKAVKPVGKRVYVEWQGSMPIDYKGDRACIVTSDKIKAILGDD